MPGWRRDGGAEGCVGGEDALADEGGASGRAGRVAEDEIGEVEGGGEVGEVDVEGSVVGSYEKIGEDDEVALLLLLVREKFDAKSVVVWYTVVVV